MIPSYRYYNMMIRLQKIISDAGVASRRAAEELITAGRVRVNGAVVTELGTKADPDKDTIAVDGKPIKIEQKKVYIMLHKPTGYVTTMSDPEGRPVVTDLLKGVKERVYPVGRLDYDTSGLLIFTNDGEIANRLAHPRHEIVKTYRVKIKGKLNDAELAKLKCENKKFRYQAPREVYVEESLDKNSIIIISIAEGKNRQVRKMFDCVNHQALKLIRISYGKLSLRGLKEGEFRHLTTQEIAYLNGL